LTRKETQLTRLLLGLINVYYLKQKNEKILSINKIFKISGLEINPIFSVPKIMWIKENAPEAYIRTMEWLSMTDYIIFKLTGEIISSY